MESDIQLLELAEGIKNALMNSGFSTIKSILGKSVSDISEKVGVDLYIAQIVLEEAERMAAKMAAGPIVYDLGPADNAAPAVVAVDNKDKSSL
jgi:hypothetical protein